MKTINIRSLEDDWIDRDEIILHVCFEMLRESIENERLFAHHDLPEGIEKQMSDLYEWWKLRKGQIDSDAYPEPECQYDIDNDKLIELVHLRKYLWV